MLESILEVFHAVEGLQTLLFLKGLVTNPKNRGAFHNAATQASFPSIHDCPPREVLKGNLTPSEGRQAALSTSPCKCGKQS